MASIEDWSEFTEIINDLDKKERDLRESAKNADKLMVDSIRIKSKKLVENVSFDSIERVSHFWIDSQQNYQTSKPLPKLNLPENKRKIDLDLETGFDDCFKNNGLIDDYNQYRHKKWQFFLKTIKDNDLLDKHKPQFVSFGGPIAEILATVYNQSIEWKIAAEKANDVIYLFKIRNERVRGDYISKPTLYSYCDLKFLHLVTDRNDNQLNEFEKCFAINCIDFVGHKVLSLNEIDATDDENKSIDIKMAQRISSAKDQNFFVGKKLLRFWSKACVQGIDRIVIGYTQPNNYLLDIEERKVEDIPKVCAYKWSHINCLNFLKEFFTFMKSCITEENIVYEFHFKSGEENVVCHRIHPKRRPTILPQSYSQS